MSLAKQRYETARAIYRATLKNHASTPAEIARALDAEDAAFRAWLGGGR
jgi:tRNA threonylcarbamoyladenosine modification (KEOPS) complex  Pcc1 subunit